MGKGKAKIEIKKIENLQRRNVTFTKRRKGLFKKADELCRLYPGTGVAALVFSPAGKPYIFGDPSGLLGAGQIATSLDGNQFANSGSLDSVKSSGPNEEKGNWSDWDSSPLVDLDESDSDYMNNNSPSDEWDLSELASHYMIKSGGKCLDPSNEKHFVGLDELESMLMNDSFGDHFLGDVEAYANQLLEL